MDNLTHSLVGAALARTGLDRATPLATATLVVAANAPDIDVLAYLRGGWFALSFRRGITHGVPALAVLPFAVTAAMLLWDRGVRRHRRPGAAPARPGPLLGLAFLGLLTHPVLDWMNTYGMRWWLPFDGRWSYGDSLFIVDPWIWIVLGAAVALSRASSPHPRGEAAGRFPPGLFRALGWSALAGITSALALTSGMVPATAKATWVASLGAVAAAAMAGRPRTSHGRRQLARAAVVIVLAYVTVRVGASRGAAAEVRAALATDVEEVDAIMIAPRPARPLEEDVLIATATTYRSGSYRWTAGPRFELAREDGLPRVTTGEGVADADVGHALAAARLDPDVAHYLVWSRFPVWRIEVADGGWSVEVGDARYQGRGGGLAGLIVLVRRR